MSRKIMTLSAMVCISVLLLLVAGSLAQAQGPRVGEPPPIKGTPISPAEKPRQERPWRKERAPLPAPEAREAMVAGVPSHDFDILLWGEDFESGTDDWLWGGLWHPITDTDPSGYGNSFSPVTSFWYGQNATGDYDTGATNSGVLMLTTPISLPSSLPNVRLSFWSWEETECRGNACIYDYRVVLVAADPVTPTWTTIWSTDVDSTVEGIWHKVQVDLSPYIGNDIRLMFVFDTSDQLYNGYRGWYIDDVAVGCDLVALAPAFQYGYGERSETISYTITLTNNTGAPDTFDLGFSGNSWPTVLSTNTLGPIPDGGSADFNVYVTIPTDAGLWSHDVAEVTATSITNPSVSASAEVGTSHPHGVSLWAWPDVGGGTSGETITYTMGLGNYVGFDDSFTLSLAGNSWPTALSISNTGVLYAGEGAPFEVYVTIPADAPLGASDSVTVTATSDTDSNWYNSVALTTFSTTQGGYSYGDSDELACTYDWIDITGSTNYFALGENATVDLGFDFPFYGNTYSQAKASSNGFLTFNGNPWEFMNQSIPIPSEPNDLIAPFWSDLYPPGNTNRGESLVFAQTFGSVPNRYAVVEWYKVPHIDELDPSIYTLTFEAILYENGEMKFQYKEMEGDYGDGNWASVGVENRTGVIGVEYLYNGSPSENLIHDMLAICWEREWEHYIYLPLILKQY